MATPALPDLLFAIAVAEGRYSDTLRLGRHQASVYSQNGEDGMIAEALRRIGLRDRFFVEIGVGDGRQNNTRFLLEQGWRGVWVDGDADGLAAASTTFADYLASGALRIVAARVTAETIDAVLDEAGAPPSFDVLSLDIDQNTSHVWRALRRQARLACIEYNAFLPPSAALEVPYDPARVWDGTHWYGAGLKALELIGAAKGMHLVGCDLLGVNAFFVDAAETAGRFRAPFTAETHWEPARHPGHPPSPQARRWVEAPPQG